MSSLTDTQSILLSTASQRESGSLYHLPATLRPGGGTARSIATLATAGYAEEREVTDATAVHRTDADLRFGLFITAAGLKAIGIEGEQPGGADGVQATEAQSPAPASAPKRQPGGKIAAVLALLQRPDGATVAELIAATGWLPHTTRAALTGLKKKGHSDRARSSATEVELLPHRVTGA